MLKDGTYRLRSIEVEGAERTSRGPLGKIYNEILSNKLKKHDGGGVLDDGKRLMEWGFSYQEKYADEDIFLEIFESDQGSLKPHNRQTCEIIYFTDRKDVTMGVEGSIMLVKHCKGHAEDEYAKKGIKDHHELWMFTYEPYAGK